MTENNPVEFKGSGVVSYGNGIMRICVILPGNDGKDINVWKDVPIDDTYIEWLQNRTNV
jgi:hypothetical protein